jgi:hypothetical protein
MPTIFRLIMLKDNYVLGSGYSALWLICLYVIGAYFRIYGAPKWAKWYVTLPTFFAALFLHAVNFLTPSLNPLMIILLQLTSVLILQIFIA